jgi:hypothetical protein
MILFEHIRTWVILSIAKFRQLKYRTLYVTVQPEVADFPRGTFYIASFADKMQTTRVMWWENGIVFAETSWNAEFNQAGKLKVCSYTSLKPYYNIYNNQTQRELIIFGNCNGSSLNEETPFSK